MEKIYPVVIYMKMPKPEHFEFGPDEPDIFKRTVLGTAIIDDEYPTHVVASFNSTAWGRSIAASIHDFHAGLCQPKRDAPVEMVLTPKRAYPAS